jgi:hypothetical protein
MKVKNITENQLRNALNEVNKEQGSKLIFNREPEKIGNFIFFTIKSEKSGIVGSRVSHSGRKLTSASWHSHGFLFDKLLDINEEAIIKTATSTIDKNGGNWTDFNCGSMFEPVLMSSTSIQTKGA